ncbi:MAG TPA: hypothetical protein VKV30_06635 [Candidatus Angelobacter sp.]|nr:hypothetical protein [Candidatus Angelobacter sp.]
MKRKALLYIPLVLAAILALTQASHAQLVAGPGVTDASSSQSMSNRTFSFSGTIPGQLDGALTVTFSIYPDQQSASALWTETQIVQITGEKYSVMLGSTSATGLPPDIFSADQAHWLGVQVNGSEKRFLLVSVPYAMKAVEAERLGGLLPSDYVTVQQLQSALQSAAAPTTSVPTKTTMSGPTGQAALAGTPPQPATDFTDNNTSEVLLVTQQGTGYAIHAITSSQAEAILAQNNSIGGTALHALATNATGASIGVLAETASPSGIAGVFNNQRGGKILSLRNNGVEVASVDTSGQVQATSFSGGGFGLFGIPQSAINATPFNNPFSVVARDSNGDFAANQITAANFSGGGFGLFGIPQSAINATPFNNPFSVVARDSSGSFAANQVTATSFFGGGFGLFGIPQSAINATPFNNPFSVVARDSNGDFAANQITAITFSGGGFGLFGIPQSAINATPFNNPFSVVARDGNGGFMTGNLQVMNQLTSSGLVDFSGAVTAPVRTVLTANIPPLCLTSKELLLVTDAFPGQQLFVCNSTGNGWVLLGDGGGSAASSNVSGNTTGTLESVSQLGSGTGLTVSSTSGTAVSASSTNGTALHGDSTSVGAQGSSQGGIGVWAAATASDSTGTALLLSHASQGKLIDGGVSLGSGTDIFETFSVTAEGDVTFNGAMMTPYDTAGTWFASSLVKLTSAPGNFGTGTVAMTSPGDTSGAIGIISGLPASGSRIQVVQSGQFSCNFDGPATSGHYVGISKTTAGDCADIGASYPTDGQQVVGRVLSSFAPGSGRVLLFQSELHNGGSAGTINTGAGLTGGPITGSGTISVADGGITAAKLAPNAVTSTSIASGSITTTQLAANAVTSANLAPNSVTSVNIADGSLSPAKINGTAATLSGNNVFLGQQTFLGTEVVANLNVAAISGNSASFLSDLGSGGALYTTYPGSGTLVNGLVKLLTNGTATATATDITDSNGVIGIAIGAPDSSGNIPIAYSGRVKCVFDQTTGLPVPGDFFGISHLQRGECRDLGTTITPGSGQVLGRILAGGQLGSPLAPVLLVQTQDGTQTPVLINTGAGLTGGPITSSGTISIANNGVTNSMLQNNSITIGDGIGIGGGGTVPLGGTVTITNLGALSFNGRIGNISPAFGDYNFSQIFGTASESQLPPSVVLNTQNNTFTGNQTINGSLTASNVIARGNSTPTSAVLTVNDASGQAGNQPAFFASSSNNPAAAFLGGSGTILSVGTLTHNVLGVTGAGVTVTGTATATSFAGDGSGLSNVTASKIGTLAQADIATNAALGAETTARQSADTTLQNNVNAEAAARAAADTNLQASIAAETSARQSDVSTLQTNINNVSAADAKLAASNTFTAGTQDFSGAAATLPVHAVLSANAPAACVAGKELLIETDATAGQQLFICNATANGWVLLGDGATNGVSSFNGRNGSVAPASGDYSFAQISGSAAAGQLPSAVVYNNQANTFTGNQTVNGSVTATSFSGSGSGVTGVNAASLNGIPSNAFAQLHAINSFTSEQAFAASTAVNPSLNIPAGVAPATPLAGDVWNTGSVIQYRDNASTTRSLVSTTQSGGLQLLKLSASITPANVTSQVCTEQSFTVSGISTGDVLLGVSQPSTSSPGTNIAIGGFRVSAANTVAVQFCNVSRNNSTPVAGIYTFALMR